MNSNLKPSKIRQIKLILDNHPELKTDPVFLLGNGKSRQQFNLERLRGKGTIIGCNALYRDFTPDILIAIDAKMLNEIKASKYWENNLMIIPHNRHIAVKNAIVFKTDAYNTSGCFAMKFIQQVLEPTKCYMLGMDAYKGNMYDATPNYSTTTLQNFSGVKNYYLKELVKSEYKTVFVNVNYHDEWPEGSHQSGRYEFMSYEDFENTVMA